MGLSQTDIRCKRHPKQRQAPGVCSACLRERLSQLSTRNNKITAASSPSSSVSSSAYSSTTSSLASPVHHRVGSASMKGPMSVMMLKGDDGLFRSKSMAFISEDMSLGVDRRTSKKKKTGFWSRLIKGSSVKRKTLKEVLNKAQANQLL